MSDAAKKTEVAQLRKDAPLNIYQRINEVRKNVWYVKKDKTVSTGGSGSYKAATHDAVTALVRNHLINQGVLIVPRLMQSAVVGIGETKNGTPVIRYEAKYEVDFINCDEPSEKITVPIEAHANDSGDKAPGKAVSYATKYAILKLFNIETGEDEESRVEPWGGRPLISEEQVSEIEAKLAENEIDRKAFMTWAAKEWKINEFGEIPVKSFDACMKQLDGMIAARKKRQKND